MDNRIIAIIVFIIAAPFIGGLLDGIDRKISARMQGRKGPVLIQPFYDVFKLLNKELLVVNKSQLFLLLSYLIFTIFAGSLFFGGFDLLMVFFVASTAAMFLLLASTATHSPYSTVGSHRELIQMMCCEPMELLTAVGFYMASQIGSSNIGATFMVKDLIQSDKPAIMFIPGFFIGFVFILTIKFRKSPFDLSTSHHAHQEVIKGVTTEMAGSAYALTEIAEWYENVMLLGVVGLFFVTSNPISYVWAAIAIIVIFFLEILIDNVSARVKWDLMFKMSWGAILIFGGINLFILNTYSGYASVVSYLAGLLS